MKPRKRRVHVATGADAAHLRRFCIEEQDVEESDVVFHLAQCLSFLLQGSDASILSERFQVSKNKFAIRKLRTALKMVDEVFTSKD